MFQHTSNALTDRYTTNTTDKILENVDANKQKNKEDYHVIVFPRVAHKHICFRECAKLIRICDETGCQIHISAGEKRGSSESLISLLRMEIKADTSLTVTIRGKDTYTAFHRCTDILDGKTPDEDDAEDHKDES